MSTESFGMMNSAYFVSRTKLINWINELLQLEIKKVEDCASGAIYCQIIHSIFGSKALPIKRVDFGCKYSHEFIRNYKILQESFIKLALKKTVPADKLMKAKYQDNLEFLQWIYMFYQRNTGTEEAIEYDALAFRKTAKNGKNYKFNIDSSQKSAAKSNFSGRNFFENNRNFDQSKITSKKQNPDQKIFKNTARNATKITKNFPTKIPKSKKDLEEENLSLKNENEKLSKIAQVAQIIENERDFYYQKMFKIEQYCKKILQNSKNSKKAEKNLNSQNGKNFDENFEENFDENSEEKILVCKKIIKILCEKENKEDKEKMVDENKSAKSEISMEVKFENNDLNESEIMDEIFQTKEDQKRNFIS